MLSSHKAVRPPYLHGSSAKAVIRNPSAANIHSSSSPSYSPSDRRGFSWGAKHKISNKNAGKVWKGFSTQDYTRARKQLYRGTFWNHHCASYLRRRLPFHDLRLSSSWGKSDQASTNKKKADEKAEEDWYNRYQTQKKNQYNDFMKKMEEDPVGMLFGTRWAKWVDRAEVKCSYASSSDIREENHAPKHERTIWDWGYGPPSRSSNSSKENDRSSKPTKSETIVVECLDRDYGIDPITNRRVQKVTPSLRKPNRPEVNLDGKPASMMVSGKNPSAQDIQQGSSIPVKRFVPPITNPSTVSSSEHTEPSFENEKGSSESLDTRPTPGWLEHEGFGPRRGCTSRGQSVTKNEAKRPRKMTAKIESALDRHLQGRNPGLRDSDRTISEYRVKENTTEYVDLLGSSDVRASAGLRGRSAKESDAEKQARQHRLEEEYDSRPLRRENQLAEEVAKDSRERSRLIDAAGAEKSETESNTASKTMTTEKEGNNGLRSPPTNWGNELSEPAVAQETMKRGKATAPAVSSERANKIRSQIVPLKARLDTIKADYDTLRQRWLEEKRKTEEKAAIKVTDMHEAEVKAQKVAMEALESRDREESNTRTTADDQRVGDDTPARSIRRLQSHLPGEGDVASNVHEFAGRDRWYKKKAPHAKDEMDAKLQQLTKDQALVREVRGIYEETYGTIDTSHRQKIIGDEGETPIAVNVPSQSTQPLLSKQATGTDVNPPSTGKFDNTTNPDPLAVIQRLFDALRQAQTLAQDHHKHLQQILDPNISQILGMSESAEALAIIQKLSRDLRQAQAIIQDQRVDLTQTTNPKASATMLRTSKAYIQTMSEIMKLACKLASITVMTSRSAASKSTVAETKETNSVNVYRILAFDSARQKVITSKATPLAPLTKEHPLQPVEVLEVLSNPGEFLPDLMALHNKGYTVVSGTNNVLVFRKSATKQEAEEADCEEINHVDLMGREHYFLGTSSPTLIDESIKSAREKQRQVDQDSIAPVSVPCTPSPSSSIEAPSPKSSSADSDAPALAVPASESNLPPGDKVRREEAVFSGSARGNWQEAESKRFTRKHRRTVKRSQKLKNMLVTGTVTAACCYAVGVISQMMQH